MRGNHAHHTLLHHHIYHTNNTLFNYQIDMPRLITVYSIAQTAMHSNAFYPGIVLQSLLFCVLHCALACCYLFIHDQAYTCTECEAMHTSLRLSGLPVFENCASLI